MYSDNNIEGWMTENELQWLFWTANSMHSVAEIGSWKGRSTHSLLSGCPGPVFAIDHFKGSPDELTSTHKEALKGNIYSDFLRNVGQFSNLSILKMDSVQASKFFKPKSIDMIFIDGSHTYKDVLADIRAWLPKCKKILCGHDFERIQGISDAFAELKMKPKNEADTIWSYKII